MLSRCGSMLNERRPSTRHLHAAFRKIGYAQTTQSRCRPARRRAKAGICFGFFSDFPSSSRFLATLNFIHRVYRAGLQNASALVTITRKSSDRPVESGMTSMVRSVFLLLQTGAARVVTGHVSVEGGAPVPSSLTLPLIAAGGAPTPGLRAAANRSLTIRPQIDGAFRVPLPPGEYRVDAPTRLPPGYTLQSMLYGDVDLLRSPLKISPNDSAELRINLAVKGPVPTVSVSGRVTGIAPGNRVLRISLREPSGGDLSAALETSIGADGSFKFTKVL